MVLRTVSTCQNQDIIIIDVLLLISQLQEIFINLIQLFLIHLHVERMQTALQSGTSAASSQHNRVVIDTYIVRIDNLIGLHILQHAILMDTRRVSEGVTAYDSLIRLHRHIHQARHHAAGRIDLLRIDIGLDIDIVVTLDNHSHLFERRVTGTLTDTVDGHLHLTGPVQHTSHGVGSCHAQVVMTMG